MSASSTAVRFGRSILRFVMPPLCLVCHAPVAADHALCVGCWSNVVFIEPPVCERLGIPFPYEQGEGAISAAAIADPPNWGRARGAVAFNEVSRRLVHALKYHDRHEAGFLMARMMARAGLELLEAADTIVPIPLHRYRLWSRRYKQSMLLARHIGEICNKPVRPDFLSRARSTPRQAGLDKPMRRRNVRNAFAVVDAIEPELFGRRIVLVDDVLTTGATAEAATDALFKAGAQSVDVLAFALVLQPKRLHI